MNPLITKGLFSGKYIDIPCINYHIQSNNQNIYELLIKSQAGVTYRIEFDLRNNLNFKSGFIIEDPRNSDNDRHKPTDE